MKCCICDKTIRKVGLWTAGNNAQPVAEGRCCAKCNKEVVIPMRLQIFKIHRDMAIRRKENVKHRKNKK